MVSQKKPKMCHFEQNKKISLRNLLKIKDSLTQSTCLLPACTLPIDRVALAGMTGFATLALGRR